MASDFRPLVVALGLSVLAGCATIPYGPAVPVVPGDRKTLSEFQNDDAICRRFAEQQVNGLSPTAAQNDSVAKSAVVGTALGAAAGAAFGGGEGAAIGAGTGLLAGSAIGAGTGAAAAETTQYRYDNAYAQCMTLQGNRLPYEQTAALQHAPDGPPPPPHHGPPPYGPAPYGPPPYGPPPYGVYEFGYYETCPGPYYYHGHYHHHGHRHHRHYY
jgi:hypothetical protein